MKRMYTIVLIATSTFLFLPSAARSQDEGGIKPWTHPGIVRLSWDGCDPYVGLKQWGGPGLYQLVASVANSSVDNNGHQLEITIVPDPGLGFPDAWRFDSGGCQAGFLTISFAAVSKSCTAFQGGNPIGFSRFSYDQNTTSARLTVANVYDEFHPDPARRYVLWKANFDHTYSTIEPSVPDLTCGDVKTPLTFHLDTATLLVNGQEAAFLIGTEELRWEVELSSPSVPFPTEDGGRTTWGRVKGLYR